MSHSLCVPGVVWAALELDMVFEKLILSRRRPACDRTGVAALPKHRHESDQFFLRLLEKVDRRRQILN